MAKLPELGRLEKVNLRDYWVNEATYFTPYLALSENLNLLSDTVGMELELMDTESSVGPFRAAIGRREIANNEGYELKEPQSPYNRVFAPEKSNLRLKIEHIWQASQ